MFDCYLSSLFRYWELFSKKGSGFSGLLSEEEFLSLARDLACKVIIQILATKPGARVVLEKTPGHAMHWRNILKVFPEARFIHMVRDPRATVASLRDASRGWADGWPSRWIGDNARYWAMHVSEAHEISTATKNYIEVKYRDLVSEGPKIVQSLFRWCGVEVSGEAATEIFEKYRFERLVTNQLEQHELPFPRPPKGFFRKGKVESWRSDLTRAEIYLVEQITRDWMMTFGYEPVTRPSDVWRSPSVAFALVRENMRRGLAWRFRKMADSLCMPW